MPSLKNTPETFKANYIVDRKTQCWNWQLIMMRFRVGMVVHHPRRYAFILSGKILPPSTQLFPSCGNHRCVNPDHAQSKNGADSLDKFQILFLRLNDFGFTDKFLARKYLVSRSEAASARLRTLELIVRVKRSTMTINQLADANNVPPNFIRAIQKITLDDFEQMKIDPNISSEADEFELNKGQEFKL